jgi:hypothetical protein
MFIPLLLQWPRLHLEFICADAHIDGTGLEIPHGQQQRSNHSLFTTNRERFGSKLPSLPVAEETDDVEWKKYAAATGGMSGEFCPVSEAHAVEVE